MVPLLQAHSLSRTDHGKPRVQGFSLTLHKGEIVGLLGVNGAGKSTTLALLSGALAASSGKVLILGEPIDRRNRKHVGLLPETPPLYPELSVDENLDFAARLHRCRGKNLDRARARVKQSCGLEQHGGRLIRHLSKGFRLRTAIAQALIHDPQVLLLDEPTAGLDPLQAREIRQLISTVARECGVIIATHDLTDIQEICTRVVVLNAGRQLMSRSIYELRSRIRIRLAQNQEIEALAGIEGISDVQKLDDGWYVFRLEGNASTVATELANTGWGLEAYIPEAENMHAMIYQMIDQGVSQS